MVGDSLGGSVALELQRNHPELRSRTYSAPVVDVSFRPNASAEWGRNLCDPISMFGTSVETTMTGKFYEQRTLAHQYEYNAKRFLAKIIT